MSRPDVTVIVACAPGSDDSSRARGVLERYLPTTGLSFQLLDAPVANRGGANSAVRAAWAEARGNVVVILDPAAVVATSAVGDAIALVTNATRFRSRARLPGQSLRISSREHDDDRPRWRSVREAAEGAAGAAVRRCGIRLIDRRNGYRSPRRCPICFSSEVWTCAQIPGDVIRACSRCKCRYRSRLAECPWPTWSR